MLDLGGGGGGRGPWRNLKMASKLRCVDGSCDGHFIVFFTIKATRLCILGHYIL